MKAQNLKVLSMTVFLMLPGVWASAQVGGLFETRPFIRTAAAGVQVTITREDCRRILRHSAEGDAAYLPGVDARGRKVTPADLPGSQAAAASALPERIVIDLEAPLGRLTPHGPASLRDSTVGVGQVSIGSLDGDVRLNDRPVGDPVLGLVREACRRAGAL